MSIIRCNCCNRQFVLVVFDSTLMVSSKNAIKDIAGYICSECSKDLDTNGLFPEER